MAQRYLNKFQDTSAYNTFKQSIEYTMPSVSYCVRDNMVMFDPALPSHDYVDLGLPSGTLWATCNIGAETPYEVGQYFAWGETTGYTIDQIGVDKYFYNDGSDHELFDLANNRFTKYYSSLYNGDGKVVLEPDNDAASVNWGPIWCMPTATQMIELFDYTTQEYDSSNNGIIFESTENGNTLFIPLGIMAVDGGSDNYYGENVMVIRSSYRAKCANFRCAQAVICNSSMTVYWRTGYDSASGISRFYGIPVRPVRTGFVDDPENLPDDTHECRK